MKKTLLSIVIALILMLIIINPTFAEVTANIYDGYDFTIKETVTVTTPNKDKPEDVIIEINKNIVGIDSPYQYNYGIEFEMLSTDNIEFEEIENNDTDTKLSRKIIIKNAQPNQEISYNLYYRYYNARIKYNLDIDDLDNYKYDKKAFAEYLKSEDKIECNSRPIKEKAREIVGDETNPFLKAKKIFAYVNTSITYDLSEKNKGALNALKTGKCVCEDYADLFAALCRAEGIPARIVFGIRYFPNGIQDKYTVMTPTTHAWVEFYVPNEWIIIDATDSYMNRIEPAYDSFAQDSAGSHIVFLYENTNSVQTIIRVANAKSGFRYLGGGEKERNVMKTRTEVSNIIELINHAKNNDLDNIDELNVLANNLQDSEIKDKLINTIKTLVMVDQENTLD